jgi:eukaryotic-like serine/threonine-protein kinase
VAESDGQRGDSAPGVIRPGTLTALLQEIAAAPQEAQGGAWEKTLRAGVVVGRFELVRELGRGGFGVVWEARDRELGRPVAFKAVRAGGKTTVREERLLREAEAAARLSHPNIVTLHDVGRAEAGPFLVMELLRGETLSERLAQGPLPVAEAVRVAAEVAKGLAHAHGEGVVHRDLKPENVFLCEDGQVKVLDFGLAHAFGRRRAEGGTSGYMAPEQAEGAPEDERTDVFALGVILFELLSGKLPFEDERALRSANRAPALEVPGEPALGELVSRMLAKKPVERPRDGAEVLSALSAFDRELARAPATFVRRVRTRRWLGFRLAGLLGAGLAIGAGIAAVGIWWAAHNTGTSPTGAIPSIAVLPFADMSASKDQEYFADGIAEEILNALVQVEGLRVAGRSSSFAYKGKNEKVEDIGRALHVGAVLEGSVRKAGHRVRIAAELVATADGFHLWSHSYERDMTDVFAVQDDIAHAVVGALQVKLLPGRSVGAREHLATHPDAYSHYLLGRQLFHLGSPEGYRSAVAAYEKALAIDPKYAPAWAGLAVAANYASNFAVSGDEFERFIRRSREAGPKAVEFDPDFADGFAARGYARAMLHHNWKGAAEDMERAISLSPRDAEIRRLYAGFVLGPQGRTTQAIESARLATELDPGAPLCWNSLGFLLTQARQYAKARAALDEALRLNPDMSFAALNLAKALVLDGDAVRALPVAAGAISPGRRLTALAIVHHSLGNEDESRKALDALVAQYSDRTPYQIATVYAWRGERKEAFTWLDRAAALLDREMFLSVKADPMFGSLHGDARFEALLRKMNLTVE